MPVTLLFDGNVMKTIADVAVDTVNGTACAPCCGPATCACTPGYVAAHTLVAPNFSNQGSEVGAGDTTVTMSWVGDHAGVITEVGLAHPVAGVPSRTGVCRWTNGATILLPAAERVNTGNSGNGGFCRWVTLSTAQAGGGSHSQYSCGSLTEVIAILRSVGGGEYVVDAYMRAAFAGLEGFAGVTSKFLAVKRAQRVAGGSESNTSLFTGAGLSASFSTFSLTDGLPAPCGSVGTPIPLQKTLTFDLTITGTIDGVAGSTTFTMTVVFA